MLLHVFCANTSRKQFAAHPLSIALWLAAGLMSATTTDAMGAAQDDSVQFDSEILDVLGQKVDLSRFERAGSVEPGTYKLQIYINSSDSVSQSVVVKDGGKDNALKYCFKASHVKQWGVDASKLPDQEKVQKLLASDCVEPGELIPQAAFEMDIGSLSGRLSIPQAYAGKVLRNYVAPEDWDSGINAGFVSYNGNAYRTQSDQGSSSTEYNVGLNAGVNIGEWRLRHNGNYRNTDYGSKYQAMNSYAQTDVTSMKSQLTVGEYFTPSGSFDSFPFTGMQIASDDSMLPDAERGFAPVVRGTADTNAKVTIRQGSSLIYETTVAPGPFAIDDLYATSYSGDLDVTVTEADGSEKRFTVPFSSVVQMLRPGSSRMSVTAGRYRDENLSEQPQFIQGTYRRGVSNDLSLYGGGILSQDYSAVLGGVAISTPYGGFAVDTTLSRATNLPGGGANVGGNMSSNQRKRSELGERATGQSYRVSYSKLLETTDTNFAVAAYRFSSEDYLDFADFVALQNNSNQVYRERNRVQLNLSQPLGGYGDLYVSGLASSYWDERKDDATYQLGYSKTFNWGSVGVTASRTQMDEGYNDQYMLSVSLPLGSGYGSPRLNNSVRSNSRGDYSARTDLNGMAGADRRLSYGVYATTSSNDSGSAQGYGGSAQYETPVAAVGGSASVGEGYKQYSATARGTALAHADGVVFSPAQGETMALIEADGAAGVKVGNGGSGRVNSGGYAMSAGLSPYRNNAVSLDPKGLSENVELQSTSETVTPRRGAIVKVKYETVIGKPVLLQIQSSADQEIPFGADVVNAQGESVAMVGQGGLVFLRGEQSELRVVWGGDADQSCLLLFNLPQGDGSGPYEQVPAQCKGGASAVAAR